MNESNENNDNIEYKKSNSKIDNNIDIKEDLDD